jgi:hypothetical protein
MREAGANVRFGFTTSGFTGVFHQPHKTLPPRSSFPLRIAPGHFFYFAYFPDTFRYIETFYFVREVCKDARLSERHS